MNKVQTKRLLNVAKSLRDAHKAKMKFDMGNYVFGQIEAVEENDSHEQSQFVNTEANFCGSPSCALGHFAARTDLQRVLKIAIHENTDFKYAQLELRSTNERADMLEEELLQYFGLNKEEMKELFSGVGCRNAKSAITAAKYIEKFVASRRYPRTTRR